MESKDKALLKLVKVLEDMAETDREILEVQREQLKINKRMFAITMKVNNIDFEEKVE